MVVGSLNSMVILLLHIINIRQQNMWAAEENVHTGSEKKIAGLMNDETCVHLISDSAI